MDWNWDKRTTVRLNLESIIADLTAQMTEAAGELKFELAGRIRDELHDLKRDLRQMRAAS